MDSRTISKLNKRNGQHFKDLHDCGSKLLMFLFFMSYLFAKLSKILSLGCLGEVSSNFLCWGIFTWGFNKTSSKTLRWWEYFLDPSDINSQSANNKHIFSGGSLATEAFQKKKNKSQYLYQQLSRIERDLTLLGPSSFHSPHSYSQAMQQVEGMTTFLEDQSSKFSHFDLAEPIKNQWEKLMTWLIG